MSGEVWVWLPRDRTGALSSGVAAELLYEGGALARRLDADLVAAADRAPPDDEAALLGRWGVARLRLLEQSVPPHPIIVSGASPLRPLLQAAGEAARPRAVLFAADTFGRVTAPLLTAELAASGPAELVTGATSVTCDHTQFVAARPALGEQYEALARIPLAATLVATLRPGAIGEPVPPPGVGIDPAALREGVTSAAEQPVPQLLPPDPDTLDLADAERIVAFGRGAFSREAIGLVERLARALGATVAGTRPAADEGWLPFARQVGLTGAIVQPRLYVAVGISGAPYHMVGIKDPETLIAINSDAEAPIFAHATLGIVGDLFTVLPALLERVERGEAVPGLAAAAREAHP